MARLLLDGKPVTQTSGRVPIATPARRALSLEGVVDGLQLDERPLLEGTTRLPLLPGELSWREASGARVQVRLDPSDALRPPEAEAHCVTGFARRLHTLRGGKPLGFGALDEVPLFFHDGLWRDLTPEPFDAVIARHLGALFALGAQPRSRLREEHAVLPVERVRRVTRDADRHLVWRGQHLVAGLVPRVTHLKARLLEDDFDLYENRVLLTLCRALRDRAQGRMARAQLALDSLGAVEREVYRLARLGLHQRAGRWRKAAQVESGDLRQTGERYLGQLRLQLEACLTVIEGPVGRAVGQGEPPGAALLDTNLFAYDERYGEIARLWREWQTYMAHGDAPDPVLDDVDRGYRRFARLVLAHALRALRFEAQGAVPTDDDDVPLSLERDDGWTARLEPRPHGARLTWQRRPEAPATPPVAPRVGRKGLPAPLPTPPQPPESSLEIVATFDRADRDAISANALWLHPVVEPEATADAYLARMSPGLTPRRPGGNRPAAALPVAPWHFPSVHGVMRALRARLLGSDLADGRIPERCPICGEQAHAKGEDRTCTHDKCGAVWGRRQCGHCLRAGRTVWIPKLLPKLPQLDPEVLRAEAEATYAGRQALLDTLVGPDGLADLCLAEANLGSLWMSCPECGRCGADEQTCATCPRCR